MNSEVYLANDPQLGGQVAAKEIDKSRFVNQADYFEEAQTMFAVAHDSVVAVQYACQTQNIISLVMPFYIAVSAESAGAVNMVRAKTLLQHQLKQDSIRN